MILCMDSTLIYTDAVTTGKSLAPYISDDGSVHY